MFLIVGLGNPGEEYENTRHNVGRIVVEAFRKKQKFPDWEKDSKISALISSGKIGKEKVFLALPETFMNKSGLAVQKFVSNVKCQMSNVVVVYDDLDLPLGKMKISFNRGSGGHRGIESIAKTLKTKEFIRVRIGISPETPSGKLKKPSGEEKVKNFILGKFSNKEFETLKKVSKDAVQAIEDIVSEGLEKAMGKWN